MSSHSFPKIDQKEYLKKYLSGDKAKKKKKDKKQKKSSKDSAKVKIIDDDINHLDTGVEIDEELLLTGEDAPQIVGEYIEEKPVDRNVPKWKSIVIKDESEEEESRLTRNNEEDLWGRKTNELKVKQEKRSNKTPDNTPKRKKDRRRKSFSSSPPRFQRKSPSSTGTSKGYNSPENKTKDSDSKNSPDRKRKVKTEPLSPPHVNTLQKIQNKDSLDASPPRRRRNSDQSPARRKQSRPLPAPRFRKNSDLSPPRKEKNFSRKRNIISPDNSAPRHRRNSGQTPPRNSKNVKRSPDNSSPRHRRNFNQSPARKRQSSSSNDQSPPRKSGHYNALTDNSPRCSRKYSNQSPTRKYKNSANKSKLRSPGRHRRVSTDSSPPRRSRSTDQSPPRFKRNANQVTHDRHKKDLDQSPPRKRRYSSDVSPRNRQRTETPDNSPPRKSRKTPDRSPPRRRHNSDQSPPRQSKKLPIETLIKLEKRTSDSSPQRTKQSRWEKQETEKSLSPPPTHKPKPGKTLEGKKAGLQNAQALQIETKERRKKEDLLFETMSSDISGRNAEVQVRSTGRKGRRAREAADEDPEERRRKEEYEEKKKQQYDRWSKGLKQIEDHKNLMLQQEYESSKPLARYANDEDLERHLKEQERAEDPMLEYMRQKRKEKEKQSGKPEIPRYEGPYPENRFGIRPGYRWDGVDRSNGYEKKYFAVQNEKQARQDEAYKYSVEDM